MEKSRGRAEEDSISVGGNQLKLSNFKEQGRSDCFLFLPPTCIAPELPALVQNLPRIFIPTWKPVSSEK